MSNTVPPFSTSAYVAADRFRWIAGREELEHFENPGLAHLPVAFCRDCSSPMPVHADGSDRVMIPAGSIDQDPGIRPQAHIRVASRAPWMEIRDDLPRFDGDDGNPA